MLRIYIILLLVIFLIVSPRVFASELDDIPRQINEIQTLLEGSKNASRPLEKTLRKVEADFSAIEANIALVERDIVIKQRAITEGEKKLGTEKDVFDIRVRSYYKNSRHFLGNSVGYFLSNTVAEAVRKYFYQQRVVQQDRDAILKTAFFISGLEDKKISLELEKSKLSSAIKQLEEQKKFYEKEVTKAKDYQRGLEKQINELSARQQELLAQKIASIPLPRSAETSLGGCVPDLSLGGGNIKEPNFSSPRFAFFTYGVPNKTGLNQYGAKGRAEKNQLYDEILHAYYNFDNYQDFEGITINVNDGNGINQGSIIWSGDLEEYLKSIYEMPENWNIEALKAQVIAARSYVLAATNNGRDSVCANEYCQVFKKDQPKTGQWATAVVDTSKKAMVQGGNPIKAWYSSTHGGVVLTTSQIGWSNTAWTKSLIDASSGVSSFEELNTKAYDKESHWFYCDWGYRKEQNSTAWLNEDETLDIINSFFLYTLDQNTIIHLGQQDENSPDKWSFDKVREEIRNRKRSPYQNIDSIYVQWDPSGISRSIVVNGDSYDAQKFKNLFNIRAPANIQIKPACKPDSTLSCSPYALYNVEKR